MEDNFEDILLARFDELLDKDVEVDLTPDEYEELKVLSDWYEAWIDYNEAIYTICRWYDVREYEKRYCYEIH